MESIKLGDKVHVLGKNVKGEVAFVGETQFSDGLWIGIVLDEAKGRHNGSIEGVRYFKCPRNRGIFVRACQIQKECANSGYLSNHQPNYLRSRSIAKSGDNGKAKSQLNDRDHQITEDSELGVNYRDSEIQALKIENEQLKEKLKAVEQSLDESLNKYMKALSEIQNLKDEIDIKGKQIKVQKGHIKLLKLRQCNHFRKIDFSETTDKSFHQSNKNKSASKQPALNDESSNSDDEHDLENLKALASMQRVVELEEQNRIMIQGLVELRKFLNSKCQSQISSSDCSIKDNQSGRQNKNSDTGSFLSFMDPSAVLKKNDLLSNVTSSHLRESIEMLNEMKKYSTILQKKRKLEKEDETQNVNSEPLEDVRPTLKTNMSNSNNNKALNYAQHVSSQKSNAGLESKLRLNDKNSPVTNSNVLQNRFQAAKTSQQGNGDTMFPKSIAEKHLKNLISALAKTKEDKQQRNAPAMRGDCVTEAPDCNTFLENSKSYSKFQLASPNQSAEVAVKSGSVSALISSKAEQSKTKMGNLSKYTRNKQ